MTARVTNDSMMRAYWLVEALRSTGEREFPMQLASTFFYIAAHEGCLQEDVQEATAQTSSSVSRNVTWLGPRQRTGKDGLKLVYRERAKEDYKKYRLYLTPKGQTFKNLIEQQLTRKI